MERLERKSLECEIDALRGEIDRLSLELEQTSKAMAELQQRAPTSEGPQSRQSRILQQRYQCGHAIFDCLCCNRVLLNVMICSRSAAKHLKKPHIENDHLHNIVEELLVAPW